MISRRNIRIKVFQTIYELEQQHEQVDVQLAIKRLDDKIEETSALLTAITHFMYLISEYVVIHANQRASKFIPSEQDRNISVKLSGNFIMQQLKKNHRFDEAMKRHKLASLFDDDLVRKIFHQLIETETYKQYIRSKERNGTEEKSILQFILKECIFSNELTTAFLSEHFLSWYNDAEMIEAWMDKVLSNAASFDFSKLISKDKLEFAHELLSTYYAKKDIVFQLIEPKLVNWDADRVAIIDLILLHLGICELLYFPSIPVKVSINEYIDLAKEYSTLQSGQFVNGLLDNVHKELIRENKIHKESFTKK